MFKRSIKSIFFFILLLMSGLGHGAEGEITLDAFKIIPVMDEGRLKPLDTYARHHLLQFSAKDTFDKKPAIAWLARLLFTPESTKDDRIFLINNPDIPQALNIKVDHGRRYTFSELQAAYPKLLELNQAAQTIPQKERNIVENEIIRIFENLRLYAQLSHELQFAFPHSDFTVASPETAQVLNLPDTNKIRSFLDIALTADAIREATADLENTPPNLWGSEQREIMGLLANMFQWSANYRDLSLHVIPSVQEKDLWLSPWDAINGEFASPQTRERLLLWQKMAQAFNDKEKLAFDMAARNYLQTFNVKGMKTFSLELAFYGLRPFFVAKIFYIIALLLVLVSLMGFGLQRMAYQFAWGSILLGLLPHVIGLIARCIIMARPPVTSLYETFIFVSFITVLLGVFIERANKQCLGLIVAAISGTALLFIASSYSSEGDTMKMLVAVLNSNFWLGTHVLTITMGYGAACVAGLIGHIWLVQAAMRYPQEQLDQTFKAMMGILGLGLILTFLGTNLGGIWADQSWGRFWGWDPKENGALMIVLWIAMLFHVKVSRMAGNLAIAVGASIGLIVVMWAWFGVNLLSIGLHSYGFTSGIATTLAIYVICEIIFLSISTFIIRQRNK